MVVSLRTAYPQVFVSDIDRAVDFYGGMLGFRIAYLYGDPPFYGLLERDGAGLNLRHVDSSVVDPGRRDAEELLAANIPVIGITQLHAEWRNRGVRFARGLTAQPWGAEDFVIRDPDGNLLCFAGSPAG